MTRLQPLGTGGDQRSRLLRHHVPLALASSVVLALFMGLPPFDANAHPHADTFSGVLPQERGEGGPMDHGEGRAGAMDHGRGRAGPMDHGGAPAETMDHEQGQTGPMENRPGQRRSSLR